MKKARVDLSATSQGEESDSVLYPVSEPEPNPGLDGQPVRCTYCEFIETSIRPLPLILIFRV